MINPENLIKPIEFARLRRVELGGPKATEQSAYRKLMRLLQQDRITGVVSSKQTGTGNRIYLVPRDAVIPATKFGPRYKTTKRPNPKELTRLMATLKKISQRERAQLAALNAESAFKLAETAYPKQFGIEQQTWLDRIEYEHGALLLALDHFHEKADARELELARWLAPFWNIRGYWTEGREKLQRAIAARNSEEASPLQATALAWLSYLTYRQAHYPIALQLAEKAEQMGTKVNDLESVALALHAQAFLAEAQGRYDEAKQLFIRCGEAALAAGNLQWIEVWALRGLGFVYESERDYTSAKNSHNHSLKIAEQIQNLRGIAGALENLGSIALRQNDLPEAKSCLERSLAYNQGIGNKNGIANCYYHLGVLEEMKSNYGAACTYLQKSLTQHQANGDTFWYPGLLDAIGRVSHFMGKSQLAARLFAAAGVLRVLIGTPMSVADQSSFGHIIDTLKNQFPAEWAEGAMWPADVAIQHAILLGTAA